MDQLRGDFPVYPDIAANDSTHTFTKYFRSGTSSNYTVRSIPQRVYGLSRTEIVVDDQNLRLEFTDSGQQCGKCVARDGDVHQNDIWTKAIHVLNEFSFRTRTPHQMNILGGIKNGLKTFGKNREIAREQHGSSDGIEHCLPPAT